MAKANKNVNKGDIQSTDAAGFQIRNGELTTDNQGGESVQFTVPAPQVAPEVPENQVSQTVTPDNPSTEDHTDKSLVDQINEAPDNITMDSNGANYEGNVDFDNESSVTTQVGNSKVTQTADEVQLQADNIYLGQIDNKWLEENRVTIENEEDFERVVQEVLDGQHGSGRERMLLLGSNYAKVQQEVNRRLR